MSTKYIRTMFVAVIVMLAAVGTLTSISTAAPQQAAEAIHTPLRSALADPSQLDACVTAAVEYTNLTFPDANGHPVVAFKKQVTDAEYQQLAPRLAKYTGPFGVLMNMVYVKGHLRVQHRGGLAKEATGILYMLTVPPESTECTVAAWGEGDFTGSLH